MSFKFYLAVIMNTDALLEKLKDWRWRTANSEGVEPFRVFTNKVLENIAEVKPVSREKLLAIKGIRDKKFARYGKEILDLLNGPKEEDYIEDKILSVAELLLFLNNYFSSLGILRVRGEITEVKHHTNGYGFFTIKDSGTEDHSVSCFVGGWKFERFSHLLEAGMEVVVEATPSLYKTGRFSLIINSVEPYGEGALKKAFEALKKKLEAKGYFDPARKRPLPEFIQKIGLVTSESGEAIRDFIKNLGEYGFQIYLLDVRVVGDYAERSIISAIKWLNRNMPALDVLVLIRGGGGLEEFQPFNSEGLADAIALSRLPIITGIGHERDETIADYTADMRFSAPTAAAVFIRDQRKNLIALVRKYADNIADAASALFDEKRNETTQKAAELESSFARIMERYRIMLSRSAERMHRGLNRIFTGFRTIELDFSHLVYAYGAYLKKQIYGVDLSLQKCLNFLERRLGFERERLNVAEAALLPLNPESILRRGYSIAYTSDKRVLKESKEVSRGEKVSIKLYKGKVISRVEEVEN